jgi:protoheme IX farnesyltransferase
MHRTKKRPLPAGLVTPSEALTFGLVLVLLGVTLLAWQVNLVTGFLSLLTVFLYVLVYTPLKRVTWWNTVIGAIPGALPPMGGWTAATGSIDLGAWVLFLILFIWQHPHFYAIAWMYRDDYERGGFKMLPVVAPDGRSTFLQVIWFSVILIPASLLPTALGIAGAFYAWGIALLGLIMFVLGLNLWRTRSVQDAKVLLKASVIYLPLFFILILGDRTF